MAFNELRVGPQQASDGANVVARAGRFDDAIVNAHGSYYEAAARGNCYFVANQAGVTSQAGLSATTPVLTLYNPIGSGVELSLLFASATFLVAFAAAATIWVAAGVPNGGADVTGTAAAVRNARVGSMQQSRAQAFTAATLPAAPVGIDLLGAGLTGAITTVPAVSSLAKTYDGSIVVVPGGNLTIQTSTASGASGMLCAFAWEEIPIV